MLRISSLVLFLSNVILLCSAVVVELDWTIDIVDHVNVGGDFERQAIGINGQWPIKPLIVNQGDYLVLHITNDLNETSALHFHGLFQNGSNAMDGALGVTDCGIAPNGGKYTYRVFTDNQHGTFWIHSHFFGQYPDGLRFPLIIKDLNDPYKHQYQEDVILSLSDWYEEYYAVLYNRYFAKPGANLKGLEPIPSVPLLSDSTNQIIKMEVGKTYKFRFLSMATLATFQVWIDGHNMTVIEVDGIDVEKFETSLLLIAPAQRYSVLVYALENATTNFALHYNFDLGMFPAEALHVPSYFNPYGVATLEYGEDFPLFQSSDPDPDFSTFDDLLFKPLEIADPFPADQEIRLDGSFALYNDSVNHGSFNSTPYEKPLVPSLLTVLTTGANATNASTYGKYTGTSILELNKGIQLILINKDTEGPHPFHLHGHVFQILARGQLLATSETFPLKYRFDYSVLPLLESVTNPVRRDTVTVPATGYVILRFIADNPGVWFFHCHIQWHVNAGLAATFVEGPIAIQQMQGGIKNSLADQCKQQGSLFEGNAAGYFDTSTFNGWGVPLKVVGS